MSTTKNNSNGVKNSSSLAAEAVKNEKKLTVVEKGVGEREYWQDNNPRRVVVEDIKDCDGKPYINFYYADTTNVASNHLVFIYGILKSLVNEERIVMEIMNGEWDDVL